ncbi:hypothetical protein MTX38_19020 [Rhodococcus sp. ARC_M13]|nr:MULTISPECIES: hypothetical protein [unclassified Rhodococcus (in: high G+C Gram-positive bacteria)]MCJ0899169.1 hypothetical protein [Rhodococcus sp. ARC_M13]MCJ0948947.1 hypothetical protein [Rhodococcus sp. ARC_M8]
MSTTIAFNGRAGAPLFAQRLWAQPGGDLFGTLFSQLTMQKSTFDTTIRA